MIGIYKWTSPSGKYYIGQAVNLERRKKEFTTNPETYTYTSENSAIDRARRKYSDFTKWKYEILQYCEVDQLDELEIKYINEYNSTNSQLGYNCTKGGDGTKGTKWGTEKQIEALKNRRSYEGANNPNYRKYHTEEAKEKIRQARLGSKQSLETIKKKSKPVIQLSLDGKFIKEWIGASQAMKELGIDKASIGRVCQGKKKSAGGFKWSYKEIYNVI